MLPAAYVSAGRLPLTANGKLDRHALPAPDAQALAHEDYVGPDGELEQTLAALWSELLGSAASAVHDNFFDLGGHSLLAVQLVARIHRLLRKKLDLSVLFDHPRLKDLADHLSTAHNVTPPNIVSVRSNSNELPIFFVPTGTGDYSYVARLARTMEIDAPITP